MDTDGVIQLAAIIILVLLSAFFSSAETALTTVNRVRLKTLADEGNKRAVTAIHVLDKYGKMLSAILIGNNIVNLTASSLATTFAIRINLTVGIATGILTVVILILGEIVPKNMAMVYSERLALFYAGIISGLMKLMTPVIFAVDLLANGIMKVLHIDRNLHTAMTENELRTYVEVSHEDGVIESEEREMIYNLFDFSDAVAKDIMIPRIDMASISEDAGYDEVMALFKECMYTRIPVYREDKDNIIGLINIKDFILVTDKESFQIGDILREAYYTYEYKKTADLMMEMREKRVNVSFVLNEYGATVGMITLEDLIEEIVGEIRDEYDEDEEELIREVGEREYLVEGSMKLDDINDQLGTELMSEDYDSIGGLLIENLDRLPEDGETITLENGITLQVKGINQNRIINVLMTLPEESGEEETDENKDLSSKDKTSEENAS
ncbi:MAG: hemolysin family protein [Lachnospiraceae bacterium]|nr:HlyC/CorC family transporter [Lachnospiraceae bacterium]MCI7041346.1 hemolysin family protein [Lachnospiraceae bacterium]MCI7191142.1 hemolysin family protein [Lachnospiraceae bacterium]MDD7627060.1 hemolysin family protein [Lachnospiraceae bacterium]MDY4118947.1 hemolysin family protein [Lachnospiraceae bacterium]